MKVGDYVRTKKRGFQFSQIARIKNMAKDEGYKNQYFIELDHNLLPDMEFKIYEEDIDKCSQNIINLIEVGDYVNGYLVKDIDYAFDDVVMNNKNARIVPYIDCNKNNYIDDIKSIVTKEQFESMEYKVGELDER